MYLPVWLIAGLIPIVLGGIAAVVITFWAFLSVLDEFLGLFNGRIHNPGRGNEKSDHTVIENVIVKKDIK